MYFKVEGKSLVDRIHEDVGVWESKLKEYFFRIFQKETRTGGEEKLF
eukprot:CAMPEP_0116900338 /NCGR_PEP_ID=MMETSP0467-20121206/8647_1 /TAXON_ID=283647 /ORGANISM="Mesodinium pulex, Strain SPMC105" /LENGTH=46 /DNA_ID= /DNA_START= /DNA_END= /DNA_ORIENTATION=